MAALLLPLPQFITECKSEIIVEILKVALFYLKQCIEGHAWVSVGKILLPPLKRFKLAKTCFKLTGT